MNRWDLSVPLHLRDRQEVHHDHRGDFLRPYDSKVTNISRFYVLFVFNDLRMHLVLIILLQRGYAKYCKTMPIVILYRYD